MSTQQGSKILDSLRLSAGMAFGIGLLYAAFMTVRNYTLSGNASPNLGIVFAVSLLYCGVPLFVILFLVVGAFTVLRSKGGEPQ